MESSAFDRRGLRDFPVNFLNALLRSIGSGPRKIPCRVVQLELSVENLDLTVHRGTPAL